MTLVDLRNRVRVAYKKLKQMAHFQKHPLTLRRRLAEFECEVDFEEKLNVVAEVAGSDSPHKTEPFKEWIKEIRFDVVPKSVLGPELPKEVQGSFVTNITSAVAHKVAKVNYMFDGPIELHLLSVLWLMTEGPACDHSLSSHCSGSRLHQFVGNVGDHSGYLFKKYHELYAKWRDSGIQKARSLLSDDRQSVCLVSLDVQEYYYRIQLDWNELHTQIRSGVPEADLETVALQQLGAKLFKCIEEVCKGYRQKLKPSLAETHPDLSDLATCLPIGLCASPVIANWYLKVFDDAVLENVRPAHYGRYVDDILMVVAMHKPPEESDPIKSFMDQVFVGTGILNWDEQKARFELRSRPGLFLQKQKCNLQFFDAEHSTAGLEKFQKQIEENASDFALLPEDGDDSPVAKVAYDLLYDGSANKFRNVKAVVGNRWELAGHLAKQTQLHLMTEGSIDRHLKDELFRFFKGRNAIDYWDMWEGVITFFVIAGDEKGADRFREAMRTEILKINYSGRGTSTKVTQLLQNALDSHLALCMELSLALTKMNSDSSDLARLLRKSNLIRHYLVAIPLLNYTNYEGNLASPSNVSNLAIDRQKIRNTPRFVHFDECLGFVGSGFAKSGKKRDAIVRANRIYEKFHGSKFQDVTSELIGADEV